MQTQCLTCYAFLLNDGTCPVCRERDLGRGRSYHRHQRSRIINYRLGIIKNVWKSKDYKCYEQPGRLNKFNLSCNCWLCRWEKKNSIEKPKYRPVRNLY